MMNVETNMFAESLSCRSPSQLRNRLDGLIAEERPAYARGRATSCVSSAKAFNPDALSASSSRSGSLADLRKERLARAASMGESLAAPIWPDSLPAAAAPPTEPMHPRRARLTNTEMSRPRASSMPLTPSLKMFPISETESGH